MRSRWRWAVSKARSIPASGASANSRTMPRAISIPKSTGRLPCSAPAASDAKRPAPICSTVDLARSITSRAASSDISKACRNKRAAGAANASCSTSASRSAMVCKNLVCENLACKKLAWTGAKPMAAPMSEAKTLGERIDALEMRLTYQDETIETLNQTITAQWQQIDALTRRVAELREQLQEAAN